jgi:hypothetical protein
MPVAGMEPNTKSRPKLHRWDKERRGQNEVERMRPEQRSVVAGKYEANKDSNDQPGRASCLQTGFEMEVNTGAQVRTANQNHKDKGQLDQAYRPTRQPAREKERSEQESPTEAEIQRTKEKLHQKQNEEVDPRSRSKGNQKRRKTTTHMSDKNKFFH